MQARRWGRAASLRRMTVLVTGGFLLLLSVLLVFSPYRLQVADAQASAGSASCYEWSLAQLPTFPDTSITIMSVSASASNDIWAVGYANPTAGGDTRNFAMHWDGTAWTLVATPNPNPGANYLESVVALAPDNAWAVGDSSFEQKLGAIILHWDGRAWNSVDLGFLDLPGPSLYSITASSPTDLWAAGVFGGTLDSNSLILRGDGVNWSVHKTGISNPRLINDASVQQQQRRYANILYSIKARTADDVWAVGAQVIPGLPGDVRVREVQLHWNGQAWEDATFPVKGHVYITEARDVGLPPGSTARFVVGVFNNQPGILQSYGGTMRRAAENIRILDNNYLNGIVALSETEAWAVGYGENEPEERTRPLILRTTNGVDWSLVSGAPHEESGVLNDIAHIPGTSGDLVLAGYDKGAPLIEMYRDLCAAPPATSTAETVSSTPSAPSTPTVAPTFGPTPIPGQDETSRTFPETGKTIRGIFLEYWDKNGGLAQQGYPISEMFTELSALDGKAYTVQYFERAVFEYHPENQAPFNVLLSQLGTFRYQQKYPAGAPGQQPDTSEGSVLFPETGKRLGGEFLDYWRENGGLAQQGFPVSDEFTEKSDLDGKEYTVQYFERAVFEYHPENQPPFDVLLSQLGTFQYRQKYGGR